MDEDLERRLRALEKRLDELVRLVERIAVSLGVSVSG